MTYKQLIKSYLISYYKKMFTILMDMHVVSNTDDYIY